jgi:uncharacterized protein YidB (DUF937 family)
LHFSKDNNAVNHPLLTNAMDRYSDVLADMLAEAGLDQEEIVLRLNMIALPLGARIRFIPDP